MPHLQRHGGGVMAYPNVTRDEAVEAWSRINNHIQKDGDLAVLYQYLVNLENALELKADLLARSNQNFDEVVSSLRKYEKLAAKNTSRARFMALWERAEGLGYAPSVMATPDHIAGKYLAHLFKDDVSIQIKGSDGQWGETPEQALLKIVQFVEGTSP